MNAPERHLSYTLEPDEKRITYEKDQKIPNAGVFTIMKEDHTIGNLLRMQLLRDERLKFAGYQMPHPLEHRCLVKVQTTSRRSTPTMAMKDAVNDLELEFAQLEQNFREQCQNYRDSSRSNLPGSGTAPGHDATGTGAPVLPMEL
mmetsp:Transcript_1677/g.2207  ORF Transcript_1677/g.2207 Transcript_1677/m.2207 type:complete len:145 (-) Transcript_1677:118-552(-)